MQIEGVVPNFRSHQVVSFEDLVFLRVVTLARTASQLNKRTLVSQDRRHGVLPPVPVTASSSYLCYSHSIQHGQVWALTFLEGETSHFFTFPVAVGPVSSLLKW